MTCYKQWFKRDPAYSGAQTDPNRLTTLFSHPLVYRHYANGKQSNENSFIGVGLKHGGCLPRCAGVSIFFARDMERFTSTTAVLPLARLPPV
jgi:hypothetical protein